jgi:Cu2+-containing amine oxidase
LRDRLGAALPARCHGFAAGVVAFASAITLGAHWVPAHPLDPLTSQEIGIAVAELRRAGYADAAMRFALIDLDEPEKDAVLAWRPGQEVARKAFVVARRDRAVYEAVIDLVARRVERWQELPGTQSAVLAEEWTNAQRITVADAGWRQAMARRGYGSFDKVFCAPLPAGSLLDPSEAGRRLVRVTCFDTHGTGNIRARPIEGLVATVDLDAGKVIGLIDHGAAPLSRETGDFGEQPLRPGAAAPHRATGFAIDGYRVRWRGWSFRYRLDHRAGLVLSLVRHEDRGGRRLCTAARSPRCSCPTWTPIPPGRSAPGSMSASTVSAGWRRPWRAASIVRRRRGCSTPCCRTRKAARWRCARSSVCSNAAPIRRCGAMPKAPTAPMPGAPGANW